MRQYNMSPCMYALRVRAARRARRSGLCTTVIYLEETGFEDDTTHGGRVLKMEE